MEHVSVTDDIKQRLDLVDLITGSGVALRKAGRNWSGFCPFHPNTRTPAFYVFTDTQSYYCFGCHAAGDGFNFVMQRQGLDFAGALEQLAGRTGVQLQPHTAEQATEDSRQATVRQINEDAAVYWSHILRKAQRGEAGRVYAASRGLDEATIEQWQIGYAADEWSNLLVYLTNRKGHAPEEIEAAGLIIHREGGGYYDRFRNRLIFPIRNAKGIIVGFGGRAIGDDHAKYLNTPETVLFHKGSLLFGFYEGREAIREEDAVVVVEGYLDVITAHKFGFRNVVAPMGTALTTDQAGLIKRLTRTVILALDADAAGKNATTKGLDALQNTLDAPSNTPLITAQGGIRWEQNLEGTLKIATLPPGQDPDDVIQHDPHMWRQLIARAEPLLDYHLQASTSDLDLTSGKGRSIAVDRLAPIIALLKHDTERAHYVQKLARLVGLSEAVIAAAVEAARRGRAKPMVIPTEQESSPEAKYAREDELVSLLLRFPTVRLGVGAAFKGELGRFPQLQEIIRGDIREALQRTENRWIWDLWNEQVRIDQVVLDQWATSLAPALRKHALTLVQWHDTPPLPVYGPHLRAAEIAEAIALELRKTVVQQRQQQIKAMYESVEEPAEQHELLEQLMALNDYKNAITTPRQSSYFPEPRWRRESMG